MMQDKNDCPVLVSCKTLKPEFENLQKIKLCSDRISVGRALNNSVVLPFLAISRNHCVICKQNEENWVIEDFSTFGIQVNGCRLGRGVKRKLQNKDVIKFEPSEEFVYKYINNSDENFECPKKRIKLETDVDSDILNTMKVKFEQSQHFEIKHIERKILNAKQMQTNSLILKDQLELDRNRRMQQLECEFALELEKLKGEKDIAEKEKLLIEERDAVLATVKIEMDQKLRDLTEQIEKHNQTESELLKENSSLKEKLMQEREEFLSELSKESSSKQELLEKLEAKVREQEEIRLQEKQELELLLKAETEQLRIAKEKELKQLEAEKKQKELELQQQLNIMKENLEKQIKQSEQQRLQSETVINEQKELMKKLSDEEKAKMELLVQEREEIQKKLAEAQTSSEKSLEQLKAQVNQRETELATLAAERIQQQVEQSSEVITSLQEQLEKVRGQLESVESEKNTLLESLCLSAPPQEGSSKQSALEEVGELMENELQCSICAELFVAATTLNCSHTFCKYCITMWKKKKKDCPICRSPITSECKSLVLDSFIEKMIQNNTEEMKKKRREMLKSREELESELTRQLSVGTSSKPAIWLLAEVAVTTAQHTFTAEVAMMTSPTTARTTTSRRGRRRRNSTRESMITGITSTGSGTGPATRSSGPSQSGRVMATVDLTQIGPLPTLAPGPPMLRLPATLVRAPASQVYQMLQGVDQTLVVVAEGAGASLESQALTTEATAGASAAARAATGPRAAPSDSTNEPSNP